MWWMEWAAAEDIARMVQVLAEGGVAKNSRC